MLIESGSSQQALTTALEMREQFERPKQYDSLWRMWLIAARAGREAGNTIQARDYALKASEVLSKLRERWGTASNDGFRSRPDVQLWLKELDQLSGTPPAR